MFALLRRPNTAQNWLLGGSAAYRQAVSEMVEVRAAVTGDAEAIARCWCAAR